MTTYLQQEEQHNKVWEYNVSTDGHQVTVRWGRIGSNIRTQVKSFGSSSATQDFISKKVREKQREGYKLVPQEMYSEEKKTATELGPRFKIRDFKFVSLVNGNKYREIPDYSPNGYVYVEVLNSWSKHLYRILLSKNESWGIEGGLTVTKDHVRFGKKVSASANGAYKFVGALRQKLMRLAKTVIEVVKTMKVAAVGIRSLDFGDDDNSEVGTSQMNYQTVILKQVDHGGVDDKVIVSMAGAVGLRMLDL